MITAKRIRIDAPIDGEDWLGNIERKVRSGLSEEAIPLRFAITESDADGFVCEIDILDEPPVAGMEVPDSIFSFRKRLGENTERFNAALLVPTGINAEIGGHAGDATPVAKLLGAICDQVIVHPNVVNASDINEMPANALYVEGSVVCRLLMGTVGLRRVRSNRVMVVIDDHNDEYFVNAAANAVNAARASYGLNCPEIVRLSPPIEMQTAYAKSGRAVGEIGNLSGLFELCKKRRNDFDALAISSVIRVPPNYHQDYFDREGEMVNPWGGVEAMLTHAVSEYLDIPSAHAPMFESRLISDKDPGIVDPRMAAEAVSLTFLQCVLKGLHQSPRIVTDAQEMQAPDVLTASEISCLVIPDKCVGLPTLAALFQGIPVIAVRESQNLMQNDLEMLPWQAGQLHVVENYWEAAGVISALRAGIDPMSVRRPIERTSIANFTGLAKTIDAIDDSDVRTKSTG
ncbi:MAG: DUF3326 domain-containing protein [Alphaproteobacteria bacterium]|nr:DUF3326 domain-containing protein [Alphaproteobacteria bacterium]